jgi:hypothetical protein
MSKGGESSGGGSTGLNLNVGALNHQIGIFYYIAFFILWHCSRSRQALILHQRKAPRKMQQQSYSGLKVGHDGYIYQTGNQNLMTGKEKEKKEVSSTN